MLLFNLEEDCGIKPNHRGFFYRSYTKMSHLISNPKMDNTKGGAMKGEDSLLSFQEKHFIYLILGGFLLSFVYGCLVMLLYLRFNIHYVFGSILFLAFIGGGYFLLTKRLNRLISIEFSDCSILVKEQLSLYVEHIFGYFRELSEILKNRQIYKPDANVLKEVETILEEYRKRVKHFCVDEKNGSSFISDYIIMTFDCINELNKKFLMLSKDISDKERDILKTHKISLDKILKNVEMMENRGKEFLKELSRINNVIIEQFNSINSYTEESAMSIINSLNRIEELSQENINILNRGNDKILSLWNEVTGEANDWKEMLESLREQFGIQMEEFKNNV